MLVPVEPVTVSLWEKFHVTRVPVGRLDTQCAGARTNRPCVLTVNVAAELLRETEGVVVAPVEVKASAVLAFAG